MPLSALWSVWKRLQLEVNLLVICAREWVSLWLYETFIGGGMGVGGLNSKHCPHYPCHYWGEPEWAPTLEFNFGARSWKFNFSCYIYRFTRRTSCSVRFQAVSCAMNIKWRPRMLLKVTRRIFRTRFRLGTRLLRSGSPCNVLHSTSINVCVHAQWKWVFDWWD